MKNILLIMIFFTTVLVVDSFYIDISTNKKNEDMRFVYISYLEYLNNFKGNSNTINKTKIDKMIDNINFYKFNTIIIQVSPFSDAIYNSKIFPYSHTLTGKEGKNPGFDYLEYFIKKAHNKNISVHAWINPYRVSSSNDLTIISKDNPAIKFLNTSKIGISEKGIYYNPASEDIKKMIENQVLELITNYKIDGIHFDDYFYIDYNIDKLDYEQYLKNNDNITIKEFRLMHTNDLIKRIGKIIKENKKDVIFSIAPDGNINNNYNYHYADVKTWIELEYIDIIMPQLYYGFENQYLPFEKAYNMWNDIIKNSESDVKMIPVLAFYKIGDVDNNAGSGKNEWLERGVIEKQIKYLKKLDDYYGFGLFRYDFLFNNEVRNVNSVDELDNIRNLCK